MLVEPEVIKLVSASGYAPLTFVVYFYMPTIDLVTEGVIVNDKY